MEKKMSLFDLVSVAVGSVIGAGIFSMLGTGIAMTGRSVTLALVAGMILIGMTSFRSVIMANMFALKGGAYAQQALVLPKLMTGASATIYIITNISFSVFGLSIAAYLTQLIPAFAGMEKIIAVLVLVLFFFIASKGAGSLSKVQNLMTVMMYAALILFIVFGFGKVQPGGFEGEPFFYNGTSSFLMACAIMSYTCNGAINVVNMSDIADNPKRNVPLSFLLGTVICAVLYALLGYVASGVLPYAQSAGTSLGAVAQAILPGPLYIFFIIGGAMFALGTSLLGGVGAMSAPIAVAAQDGWLPAFLKKKTNVLILMGIVAVIPVLGGFSLDAIVSYIMVPSMVLTIASNVLSLRLPEQFPEEWNSMSIKLSPGVYRFCMILSTIVAVLTGLFSLMSLNTIGIIGNLALTACMFIWSWYRLKKGYVDIRSTDLSAQE